MQRHVLLSPATKRAGQRPQHTQKVPTKPGNVYGDKHPVDIEKETTSIKDWKKIVGESSSCPIPGPSCTQLSERESVAQNPQEETDSDSEKEVEGSLKPPNFKEEDSEGLVARLCRKGGVTPELPHFQGSLTNS